MTLAVAAESGRGSTLVLELDVLRPGACPNAAAVAVTPADVARFVRDALADGWAPERAGKPMVRRLRFVADTDDGGR
jgi:hypothetical protein